MELSSGALNLHIRGLGFDPNNAQNKYESKTTLVWTEQTRLNSGETVKMMNHPGVQCVLWAYAQNPLKANQKIEFC